MLCERCKKNQATVHMEKILNETKTELHLCFQCATNIDAEISFDTIIKNFLSSVIELEELKTKEEMLPLTNADQLGATCPVCGMTYETFRSEGKLGCAECYKIFHSQLDSILKNIQGSSEHIGKIPNKLSAGIKYRQELNFMKMLLKDAIEQEEFELAAKLRDQIKAAESKGGQQ